MKRKHLVSTIVTICIASSLGFSAHAVIDAMVSTQKVYVNNQEVDLEAYSIDGYNYYKLRDLGEAVGFSVDYDEGSDSVMINTEEKSDTTSEEAGETKEVKIYYTAPDGTIYYPGDTYVDEERKIIYIVDDWGDLITQGSIPQPGAQWAE